MTVINKHDLNEFSPEELRDVYIDKYSETFECTKEHAEEMFLSEYEADHDFHTYHNVEYVVKRHAMLCGIV